MIIFLRHTWCVFILYKNNESHGAESGGEEPWRRFWTLYKCNHNLGWLLEDLQMTLIRIPSIFLHCVTEATVLQARMYLVAKVLNLELPHLVNEIQTQPLWLKPISTPEWLKLCHSWTHSCQITWDTSSRCIVRCPKIINNIIKAKGVCETAFGKKVIKGKGLCCVPCHYTILILLSILIDWQSVNSDSIWNQY
jgi:hypothetical protein